jgi:predicted nicotinamide N-methyase
MLILLSLTALGLVLCGYSIAWAFPPPGQHTAKHLSTQPRTVIPDRVLEIGEWR